MYDLCRAALRMSPDRVIVGEVRGGEVMQLLQSMGIGNDGSLGTIHAGSTRAAINKMLIYAQRSPDSPTPDSVLREISEVLHLLVYIKKLPDGRRAVTSIREVVGYEEGRVVTSEVFAPGPDGVGVYVKPFEPDGEPLARLVSAGFDPDILGEPYRPGSVMPTAQPKASPPQPQPAPPRPGQQPQPRPQPQPGQRPQPRPQPQPAPPRPGQQPQPQPGQQPRPRPHPGQHPQPQPAQRPQPRPQPRPRPQSEPNTRPADTPGDQRPRAPEPAARGRAGPAPSPGPARPAPGQPQRAPAPPQRAAPPSPAAEPPGTAPVERAG